MFVEMDWGLDRAVASLKNDLIFSFVNYFYMYFQAEGNTNLKLFRTQMIS